MSPCWREFGGKKPQTGTRGFGSAIVTRAFKNPEHILGRDNVSRLADLVQGEDFYDGRFIDRRNICPVCRTSMVREKTGELTCPRCRNTTVTYQIATPESGKPIKAR